jgi:hypothetical protein
MFNFRFNEKEAVERLLTIKTQGTSNEIND